jgi:serine/threonine protein kinase
MELALGAIVAIAERVYEAAKTAKHNIDQAKQLGVRVERLAKILRRLPEGSLHTDVVEELRVTLEAALQLVKALSSTHGFLNMLRSGANAARIEAIHVRLQRAEEDISLQAAVDVKLIAVKLHELRKAEACDERKYEELVRAIRDMDTQNGDVLALVQQMRAENEELSEEVKKSRADGLETRAMMQELLHIFPALGQVCAALQSHPASSHAQALPAPEKYAQPGWLSSAGTLPAQQLQHYDVQSHQDGAFDSPLMHARWTINYSSLVFARDGAHDKVRIGRGAVSDVYKATLGGKPVAVKEFSSADLRVQRHRDDFMREEQLLAALYHPSLIEVYGASVCTQYDGKLVPCLIMELLPVSLHEVLYVTQEPRWHHARLAAAAAPSPLDDYKTKMRLAQEIASGLAYLHATRPRVIHNDLKPENIMLTASPLSCGPHADDQLIHAKIIDFGLASVIATLAEAGAAQTRGTPGYMGPEKLIRGAAGSHSHLTDVFSYGVVLWQLMTRRDPYHGIDSKDINDHILSGYRPPFPLDIPCIAPGTALAALVEACWAEDYTKRPEMGLVLACLRDCENPITSPERKLELVCNRLGLNHMYTSGTQMVSCCPGCCNSRCCMGYVAET